MVHTCRMLSRSIQVLFSVLFSAAANSVELASRRFAISGPFLPGSLWPKNFLRTGSGKGRTVNRCKKGNANGVSGMDQLHISEGRGRPHAIPCADDSETETAGRARRI